ncbi:MAG: hypothetical protein DMG05_18035 [Acidobacteria bacterium]|nr:MAG: hypothetical protein DMG05_18035 [Acidobacteriota bacterium]
MFASAFGRLLRVRDSRPCQYFPSIFSVLSATLLRERPYPKDPDRVFWMILIDLKKGMLAPQILSNYLYWRDHNQVFEHLAAWRPGTFILMGGEKPERITGAYVSANYFWSVGVQAVLGRTFLPEENHPGSEPVCVLSNGLWKRRFGSDPNIMGRRLTLNGEGFTVVGILPPDFSGRVRDSQAMELWVPMVFEGKNLSQRVGMISRLKPNATLQQARLNMDLLNLSLKEQYPERMDGPVYVLDGAADPSEEAPEVPQYRSDGKIPRADRKGGWVVDFFPLNPGADDYWQNAFYLLQCAVGLVLLIACANVANLLLARGAVRQEEIAVRIALGAGRLRLIRQFFTEGLLLALMGGGLGLVLAVFGCNFLAAVMLSNTPGLFEYVQRGIALNTRVLGFTSVSALLATVVFGLAPALRASNPDLQQALKAGGRSSTEGFGLLRGRSLLVTLEIATALVLLIGTGLMIKSFLRFKGPYSDLEPENVVITEITLDNNRYGTLAQINLYWEALLERMVHLPGVRSAGAVANLLGDMSWMNYVGVTVDHPTLPVRDRRSRVPTGGAPHCNPITSDYLQTMRIPLHKGRYFSEQDMKPAPAVAIVNESFVKHFFAKDEDPLGKEIRITHVADSSLLADATPGTSLSDVPYSIVGVVKDLKSNWEFEQDAKSEMYFPYVQTLEAFKRPMRRINIVVRADSAPLRLVGAIRKTVSAIDADQPIGLPVTLEQLDSESVASQKTLTFLAGIFAAMATGLASIGIYGVMAYFVARRTREIGIRVALGAQVSNVLWLVLGDGLKLVLAGVGLGLVGAFNLTRILSSYIFGVSPTDLPTFVCVPLLLSGVALAACYLPARRATKVDPMVALRYE